jgi:hypothetical protein
MIYVLMLGANITVFYIHGLFPETQSELLQPETTGPERHANAYTQTVTIIIQTLWSSIIPSSSFCP